MRSVTEGVLFCRQCGRTYYRDVHIYGDKDGMNKWIRTEETRCKKTKKPRNSLVEGLAAWSVAVPETPIIFVKLEVYLSYKSNPVQNMQHIYSCLTPYSVILWTPHEKGHIVNSCDGGMPGGFSRLSI